MLCVKLVEIGKAALQKKIFLKVAKVFLLFRYHITLESGVALSIEQIWIPFTEECFVPILIEIDPVFLWAQISL